MKRLLLLSVILLLAASAFAQVPTFQVSFSNARTVRGEGLTEAVGTVNVTVLNAAQVAANSTITIDYSAPISAVGTLLQCTGGAAGSAIIPAGGAAGVTGNCTAATGVTASRSGNRIVISFANALALVANDTFSIQSVRVNASGLGTGSTVTATVSTPNIGLAITGLNTVTVATVLKPSISAVATPKVGNVSNPALSVTTCVLGSINGAAAGGPAVQPFRVDVSENTNQALTTAAQELALTPGITVTNGTQIHVILSGVPTGYKITPLASLAAHAAGSSTSEFGPANALVTAAAAPVFVPNANGAQATSYTSTGAAIDLVWEVTSADPNGIDTITLPIQITNPATLTPVGTAGATVTAEVRLGPNVGETLRNNTNAATGTVASTTDANAGTIAAIPRFAANSIATGITVANFSDCVTNLLFPFVVANTLGFDTSVAIANTSLGTQNTPANAGTCTFTLFPSDLKGKVTSAPITAFTTPNIEAGAVFATSLASQAALSAGAAGYGIATCNFLLAHGYAIITNGFGAPATQPVSHGYLALVLVGNRGAGATETLTF